MAYKMVCEGEKYDLYEVLRLQLLENLKQIKKDRANPFRFGSLIVNIFFHVVHNFLGMHLTAWNSNPTTIQISKYYIVQDNTWLDGVIYGQLKTFKIEMKQRKRIPREIVEKYKDKVCFMVEIDNTCFEAMEPRVKWLPPMGYEVSVELLVPYVEFILAAKKSTQYQSNFLETWLESSYDIFSKNNKNKTLIQSNLRDILIPIKLDRNLNSARNRSPLVQFP
jgi:hypothetical protein